MSTNETAATVEPTAAARITRLAQVGVSVQDLDLMTAFYRDRIGLPFLFAAPPTMSFFDLGGVRLMLSLPEPGHEDRHASILYLEVADIAAAHAALAARGVPFEGRPHVVHRYPGGELWMAFFRDPEENVLALLSDVKTGG
jgi:methylmalonyl-CoA/ethylmalonyl-CoA epimerase